MQWYFPQTILITGLWPCPSIKIDFSGMSEPYIYNLSVSNSSFVASFFGNNIVSLFITFKGVWRQQVQQKSAQQHFRQQFFFFFINLILV